MKTGHLALYFLAQKGNPNSDDVTLKDFARQNKIGENAIRYKIKISTGETETKKIQTHQNQITKQLGAKTTRKNLLK
jgi:repressor of nif and glnA expression